jgi:hypothetical protein
MDLTDLLNIVFDGFMATSRKILGSNSSSTAFFDLLDAARVVTLYHRRARPNSAL